MKNIFILFLVLLAFGCQREKMSEVGVAYNKTLIIPPSYDLPEPKTNIQSNTSNISSSNNSIVDSILDQTEANDADESIIDKIDADSGYKTDENFFQWLFKGKSKR